MALNRAEHYPGRFLATTSEHPQGGFKNRTSPTAKDGTYLHSDWANDLAAFNEAVLTNAGEAPNGTIDTATNNQVFDALLKLLDDKTHPKGSILFFSDPDTNPNDFFTNQTWVNLSVQHAERMLRLSSVDGSGLTTGGANSITLTNENLPEHNHSSGTINVASHSEQNIITSSNGDHAHTASGTIDKYDSGNDAEVTGTFVRSDAGSTTSWSTNNTGGHTHTVTLPEMSHSVSGSTGSAGSGQAVDITNKYVDIFAWQRTE